jgi:hypothetical protein
MRPRFWKLLWIAPAALFAMGLFLALGSYVVMRLWNWLTPALFGWHTVTFWQALGLIALVRILFGGLGLPGRAGSRMRDRMRDRWGNMGPEERERFRRVMFERFGGGPAPGEPGAK